jgi:hypothetical protein
MSNLNNILTIEQFLCHLYDRLESGQIIRGASNTLTFTKSQSHRTSTAVTSKTGDP